jgi:hypothetical protein
MPDPITLLGDWTTNKPFTYSNLAVAGGWERYVQLDFYIQYTLVAGHPSALEVNVFADQAQAQRQRVDFVIGAGPNLDPAVVELKVYNFSTELVANYWTRLYNDVLKVQGTALAFLPQYQQDGRWVLGLANFGALRRAYNMAVTATFDQVEAHLMTLANASRFDHALFQIGPTDDTWIVMSSYVLRP